MEILPQFYLKLCTDARFLAAFNAGCTGEEQAAARVRLLCAEGIAESEAVRLARMDEGQLRAVLAGSLAEEDAQWRGMTNAHTTKNNNLHKTLLQGLRRFN